MGMISMCLEKTTAAKFRTVTSKAAVPSRMSGYVSRILRLALLAPDIAGASGLGLGVHRGRSRVTEAVPGQLPRPPGRPPAEPIIIRTPPRPYDDLEIDIPDDEDDDRGGEIRRPPRWVPDPPPPAPPEQRTRSQ